MNPEPDKPMLTPSQAAGLRRILKDPGLVRAGAWMVGHFRAHRDGVIRIPIEKRGVQDRCTDVRTPDWPFEDDAARTRAALEAFAAAELLVQESPDRYRRTDLGAVFIPVLPLYMVCNDDALDRRYPELRERVRGGRVIDAGCGLGPFATQLEALGAREVIALDYEPRHLAFTRVLAHCLGHERIVPLRASIEQLPLADACLDLVFCRVVLSLVHKGRTMAEFTRVLRPGGYMLLAMHAPRFFARRVWAGLISRNRSTAVSGVLGLAGGICYDLFGHEPNWRLPRVRMRHSYERRATFRRLLERNRLELLSWEAGASKPYVWVHKP